MRLWKRASGALKDQSSLWQANLSRRNPEINKSVIRATTHHDLSFDTRNAERVCDWLRRSSSNLKPILWSISNRAERTRSWVVALKALYLMHNLINTRIPCVKKIGRLPFDLSAFPARSWPFSSFVRAYYARELLLLQKLQSLVDLLMQIKPPARAAFVPLILHAMDGVIIEIYDLYSRICRGIAVVLLNIYSGGKSEAAMALNVVKKAMIQGDDLTRYFEFCHEIGVVKSAEFPLIDRIPDEGIRELEQIIQSFAESKPSAEETCSQEKAMVACDDGLRTIITENWERFDDDLTSKIRLSSPLVTAKSQEPPDLITFV